jgi:uncharacterized protein YodC (DUF2158 family)
MAHTFKPTDVVMVRSGGPRMTVTQVGAAAMTGEPTVWCTWFEKTKKFEDTFSPDALVLAPPRRAIPIRF